MIVKWPFFCIFELFLNNLTILQIAKKFIYKMLVFFYFIFFHF